VEKQVKKDEISWILYDVANSAFVLIIITILMPIFFKEYAGNKLTGAESTAWLGYASSFSALVIALTSPVMGAIADYKGNKMRMFLPFFVTGIIFTFLLVTVGPGDWKYCLILFVLARTAWAGTLVFYDAFLIDVSDEKNMDMVSSRGYAWGYIGSVIPFIIVIALVMSEKNPENVYASYKTAFIITAVWWFALTIPMLKHVRQKYFIPRGNSPVMESMKRLISGFKNLKEQQEIYLFLLAYFFYIDGVDTIITMSVAYGIDADLGTTFLILTFLMIQVLAFPFALIYGKLAEKFTAMTMIRAGIIMYILITIISFFLPGIDSYKGKAAVFCLLCFLVSTSMGGIQALSRSYFGKLIPPERSAEYFGLYNVFGKFAAILGPFMMGLATDISGSSRYGVLCILLLFAAGWFLLEKAEKIKTV